MDGLISPRKLDTPLIDHVVTYIIMLEDIRTGIARNRPHGLFKFLLAYI